MSRILEAYRVKVVTAKNVEDGATKGSILWLHSPVEDSDGYFYFVSSPDSDVGIPLAIGQVERELSWDRYRVEQPEEPGTETPEEVQVDSVPVSTPTANESSVLMSLVDEENPKDRVGVFKVDMSLVPAPATIHEAHAMMDGAIKYGPYNWREKRVKARVYVAAAMRHLQQWLNGEECAEDSGAHHLGHARACLGIIIDAQAAGKLVDDRPVPLDVSELLNRLNKTIMEKHDQ